MTHEEFSWKAARLLPHRTGEQSGEADEAAALRWRKTLLRLSETFLDAAQERSDLSPILLEALHNALEQLLIYGDEGVLMALEEWLEHEPQAERADASSTPLA